jgi:hypothetical protein
MRTYLTKLIIALRFSANASKNALSYKPIINPLRLPLTLFPSNSARSFIYFTASRDGRQLKRSSLFHSAVNQCPCVLVQYKGKVHPRIGHEGPEMEYRYSSTLSLTSALGVGGWVVNATTRPLYLRERPGTHCIGGRVGPRAGLDGC